MDRQTETAAPRYRHRLSNLPSCVVCSKVLIAPEASAFNFDGDVSYLWSCDYCGQTIVTNAVKAA
ncbi:hypothetical protein SAMN05444170_3578 [Bradyrhizobium erythrophlei]|uniref:Uncharacterized protein n=1 Tax=Bradyrhizobium erythrophlei TaxID=1437360 RepID=A0A1M7U5H3_9BRAD|nr:hypothetical protein [Bradyrhizobium erythrophlei]SHN78100.1 hypothetical protein SAMN05444170_3578 [Bradyrhizobium erythrophlei]